MCFCAAGWNQYREVKWRGVLCEGNSRWERGHNEEGSEVSGEGGGQQLKSQQWREIVRVKLKTHEPIYHASHSRVPATAATLAAIDCQPWESSTIIKKNSERRVVGELKDAWRSLFRVKQKVPAERACPVQRASNGQVGTGTRMRTMDEWMASRGTQAHHRPKEVPTPLC